MKIDQLSLLSLLLRRIQEKQTKIKDQKETSLTMKQKRSCSSLRTGPVC